MYVKSKKTSAFGTNHLMDAYIVTFAACDLFISAYNP